MQGISVYSRAEDGNLALLYHAIHERNGDYLERENEPDRFLVLKDVDASDPSSFHTPDGLKNLLVDLDVVLAEAEAKGDVEMANCLKEIMVLCKLCLWNPGQFVLILSPYEYVPPEKFPDELPDKYKLNIANAGRP